MSASREKKQRQGAGPSEKATQAQQKQASYKSKVRTYTIVGIVVVVLVAILLVWASNPVQGGRNAATIGSEKLSVAELGYYYHTARYPFFRYGLIDSSKSDADQKYSETQSLRDYFLESALADATDVIAVYHEAIKAGYKDSDVAEDLASTLEQAKAAAAASSMSFRSYLKGMYGVYMTPGVFKNITTMSLVANQYYTDKYDEITESYTTSDFEAYYAEHADELDEFEYSYLQFRPETVDKKDADGKERTEDEIKKLEEEALAAAKAKAEEALAGYNSNTSIEDLIEKYEPDSSADHRVSQGVSSISANFSEDLLKLGEDEAALVETESSGYYVIVYHGRGRNETLSVNVRHILFKADHQVGEDNKAIAPAEKLMAEAKSEAEAVLAEFLAGTQTAEAFGELANKHSDDIGSNTTGGVYKQVVENHFVAELNDWLFNGEELKVGDTAVIRHDGSIGESNPYWGYHVMYVEGFDMPTWEIDARSELSADAIEEWRVSVTANYKAALTAGAENLGN